MLFNLLSLRAMVDKTCVCSRCSTGSEAPKRITREGSAVPLEGVNNPPREIVLNHACIRPPSDTLSKLLEPTRGTIVIQSYFCSAVLSLLTFFYVHIKRISKCSTLFFPPSFEKLNRSAQFQ
ncbi:unnamed protein product, partial [Ectocarpus sp. 4 AP-2014]